MEVLRNGFSLGKGQRRAIAAALLGDPETVMLGQPVNGLDPDGVLWVRELLRGLADEGRTVFISSHLMGEVAMAADHLVVVGRGRLIQDVSVDEFIASASTGSVHLRTSEAREVTATTSPRRSQHEQHDEREEDRQ